MHEHELVRSAVAKGEVLIICTSATELKPGVPTGSWLNEVAEPYVLFKQAGYDVTIASIKGGKVPMDAGSLQPEADQNDLVKAFLADETAQQMLEHSVSIEKVSEPAYYDAIFLPGGHGTMADLTTSETLASILTAAAATGKTIISAVCHGPAGLLTAKGPDGKLLIAGKKVTGFSNTEEEATGKAPHCPYLLEDSLKAAGGEYSKGADWGEFVVVEARLVTGQNPGSSVGVAKAVLEQLEAAKAK